MSKSVFRSFQQLLDLNIQLAQTMLEETTLASNQLLTADRPTDVFNAAASRAQPAAEKLRAYQQHVSRVAADAQVQLTRVTEQHMPETVRTASMLADEVKRVATEETERSMRNQQETMRKFTDPFQTGNGQMRGNGADADHSGASSMQGAGQAGSAQGSSAASAKSSAAASSLSDTQAGSSGTTTSAGGQAGRK